MDGRPSTSAMPHLRAKSCGDAMGIRARLKADAAVSGFSTVVRRPLAYAYQPSSGLQLPVFLAFATIVRTSGLRTNLEETCSLQPTTRCCRALGQARPWAT